MNIEDIKPQYVPFTIKVFTQDHKSVDMDLAFRPYVIADEAWTKQKFELKKLQADFEVMEMTTISKLAFHQLDIPSKRKVMEVKFLDIDEEGNDIEKFKTGPEKINGMLGDVAQAALMVKALYHCRGLSMPILQKLMGGDGTEVENVKKNLAQKN